MNSSPWLIEDRRAISLLCSAWQYSSSLWNFWVFCSMLTSLRAISHAVRTNGNKKNLAYPKSLVLNHQFSIILTCSKHRCANFVKDSVSWICTRLWCKALSNPCELANVPPGKDESHNCRANQTSSNFSVLTSSMKFSKIILQKNDQNVSAAKRTGPIS